MYYLFVNAYDLLSCRYIKYSYLSNFKTVNYCRSNLLRCLRLYLSIEMITSAISEECSLFIHTHGSQAMNELLDYLVMNTLICQLKYKHMHDLRTLFVTLPCFKYFIMLQNKTNSSLKLN